MCELTVGRRGAARALWPAIGVGLLLCSAVLVNLVVEKSPSQWVVTAAIAGIAGVVVVAVAPAVRFACRQADPAGSGPITGLNRAVLVPAAVAAAVLSAVVVSLGDPRSLPVWIVVVVVAVWCALIDTVTKRMPTQWIWVGVVAAAGAVLIADPGRLGHAALWGGICGAAFVLITIITAGTPGLADARLAVLLGGACGAAGGGEAVWAWILAANIIGAMHAGIHLITRRQSTNRTIPFGPALAAGVVVAALIS